MDGRESENITHTLPMRHMQLSTHLYHNHYIAYLHKATLHTNTKHTHTSKHTRQHKRQIQVLPFAFPLAKSYLQFLDSGS